MQYCEDSASEPSVNLNLGKKKNTKDDALCQEFPLRLWASHLVLHLKWDLTLQLNILPFLSLKCTSNWNDRLTGVLWVAQCTCKCFEMPCCKVQCCQSSSTFKRMRSWKRKISFIFFPPQLGIITIGALSAPSDLQWAESGWKFKAVAEYLHRNRNSCSSTASSVGLRSSYYWGVLLE